MRRHAFTLSLFAAGAIGIATALYASGQAALPHMEFAKDVLCNGLGAVSALIVLAGALNCGGEA